MIKLELMTAEVYNHEVIEVVKDLVKDVFQAEVSVLPQTSIPPEYRNSYRGQYDGFKLLQWSGNLKRVKTSILLGLLDVDAYVAGLNFIFGIADPKNKVALVFLERLKDSEGLSSRFISRVKKEVLHELGHVLGLGHCGLRRCVMAFSNSIYDTDFKEFKYCNSCHTLLVAMGYTINSKYLLSR